MEIFDVINEKDEVVGQASRDECHSNPLLIHRAVHFTLIDSETGKVFITKREWNKLTDPGKLCFLGEHMLAGEEWKQCLIRGLEEELSYIAKTEETFEVADKTFRFPNQTEYVKFFLVTWSGKELKYDKSEIIEGNWLTVEKLVNNKNNFSDMTKHWVNATNWGKYLR